ncbi:MAG: energy transducer TonB [Acidobacteriota bacterium]
MKFERIGIFVILAAASCGLAYGQDQSGFEAAKLISAPKLDVPAEAVESGLGGDVRVSVRINTAGSVAAVDGVSGPGNVCQAATRADVVAMRNAAAAAAWQARYSPAMAKGKPQESAAALTFTFPVQEKSKETLYTVTAPMDYPAPLASDGKPLNGKAIELPKPIYPPAARAVRASGAVKIKVTLEGDGSVFSAESISGHPLLRSAARQSACSAKFSPSIVDGKPVKIVGVIVYNFVP